MAVKRKTESTALAFLDIISCGLGAVILIFLIIKHNVDIGSEQTDDLKAKLATLVEQNQALMDQTETIRQRNSDTEQAGKSLKDQLLEAEARLASLRRKNASEIEQNKIADGQIKEIEAAIPVDTIELKGSSVASYIIGLKVEGERIAILIDHSTSMTYPTLSQAIVAKFDTASQRRAAPKWQRTLRVGKWLLTRLPAQSNYSVIGFNNKAELLSPGPSWSSAAKQSDLNATAQKISEITPSEGTNLEEGIRAALSLSPKPTNIYIVTDGLPTQGSASCAKKKNITPKCRVSLLSNASKLLIRSFPGKPVPVNIILLPMTGDPDALAQYWGWANVTNGLVISPSEKWP